MCREMGPARGDARPTRGARRFPATVLEPRQGGRHARLPGGPGLGSLSLMCLAIPGKIESISGGEDPLTRTGGVNFGGIIKEASLAYVPEAGEGDYVIVHVGFALSRVDEAEAHKVFEYLREMDELDELKEPSA